jgi:hypothetical protein
MKIAHMKMSTGYNPLLNHEVEEKKVACGGHIVDNSSVLGIKQGRGYSVKNPAPPCGLVVSHNL